MSEDIEDITEGMDDDEANVTAQDHADLMDKEGLCLTCSEPLEEGTKSRLCQKCENTA